MCRPCFCPIFHIWLQHRKLWEFGVKVVLPFWCGNLTPLWHENYPLLLRGRFPRPQTSIEIASYPTSFSHSPPVELQPCLPKTLILWCSVPSHLWVQPAQTHFGQFWVAWQKTTPLQLDLESQRQLLRQYSYDVVAGALRHRLHTMGSEPTGLCLSTVTRGGRGTAGVSRFPMKAVSP